MSSHLDLQKDGWVNSLNEWETLQLIEYIIVQMDDPTQRKRQKMLLSLLVILLLDNLYDLFGRCPPTSADWYSCDPEEWGKEKSLPAMQLKLYLSSSLTATLADLTTEVTRTKADIERLTRQVSDCRDSLERLSQDCSMLQRNDGKRDGSTDALKSRQDASEQNLLTLQRQVEDLHCGPADGSLMWCIENVTQKLDDARSGRQTSIYSQVFYSSSAGYKMQARLDLNGVGDGHGLFVSVALVLCQGAHDRLLKWPFNYPIIFRLYDQTGGQNHIDDSIIPRAEPHDLQRPASDRTVVHMISKFCPQAIIERPENIYVCNDMMFLRIAVDFDSRSRVSLPYNFDDELELPTHIQQATQHRKIREAMRVDAQRAVAIQRDYQDVINSGLLV